MSADVQKLKGLARSSVGNSNLFELTSVVMSDKRKVKKKSNKVNLKIKYFCKLQGKFSLLPRTPIPPFNPLHPPLPYPLIVLTHRTLTKTTGSQNHLNDDTKFPQSKQIENKEDQTHRDRQADLAAAREECPHGTGKPGT